MGANLKAWELRLTHSSHLPARRARAFCGEEAERGHGGAGADNGMQRCRSSPLVRRGSVARFKKFRIHFRMSNTAAVTDASFEQEVLKSELPVLVDFWAPWCGPCRMVAPIVDEIAKEFDGQIKVYKLNTDENPNVASQYGIRSIPTLMIFKGGDKVDTVVGAVPKTTLSSTITKYL